MGIYEGVEIEDITLFKNCIRLLASFGMLFEHGNKTAASKNAVQWNDDSCTPEIGHAVLYLLQVTVVLGEWPKAGEELDIHQVLTSCRWTSLRELVLEAEDDMYLPSAISCGEAVRVIRYIVHPIYTCNTNARRQLRILYEQYGAECWLYI